MGKEMERHFKEEQLSRTNRNEKMLKLTRSQEILNGENNEK